jgi:hypothetical protein
MDEGTPSLREKLNLRITLSRLDAVFEACNKLPEIDKELIYGEIRKRVLQHAPQVTPESKPETAAPADKVLATFVDRCRELAEVAPNDKVRNAMLLIVRACEAEVAEAAESNLDGS